jgi:hypothetical protein
VASQDRGDYDTAIDWHRKALAIFEQLGDRAGMAGGYFQLGIIAQPATTMTPPSIGIVRRCRSSSSSATAPASPIPTTSWPESRSSVATTKPRSTGTARR